MKTIPAAKAEKTPEKEPKAPVSAEKAPSPGAAAPAAAATVAPAGKSLKVKSLRSHPAFGYFAGDEGEISQADFEKYSKDGEFFEKLK